MELPTLPIGRRVGKIIFNKSQDFQKYKNGSGKK